MIYGLGHVFDAPTISIIAWQPTNTSSYTAYNQYMQQFVSDVGGTDYYSTVTEYYSGTGSLTAPANVINVGPSATDTRNYQDTHDFFSCGPNCLGDGEIAYEVNSVAATQGWTVDNNHGMILMLGNDETVCTAGGPFGLGSQCSITSSSPAPGGAICGYHWMNHGSIYAVIPYPQTDSTGRASCQKFGGTLDAQSAVHVGAHESAEMATDPEANGWCTSPSLLLGCSDGEIGDRCQVPLEDPNADNVTLSHGHQYILPRLWSNLGATTNPPDRCYSTLAW